VKLTLESNVQDVELKWFIESDVTDDFIDAQDFHVVEEQSKHKIFISSTINVRE
jgi:hypothetical protein